MLLALDTSTAAVGAAVCDGQTVLAEVSVHDERRHAELLAPAVQSALSRAGVTLRELTGLAVGVGPGPFTGLRVGVVTALVLAHTRGLVVFGVCSLDALAAAATASGTVDGDFLVATDARRREVYWARYAVGPAGPVRVEGPSVGRAADLAPAMQNLPAVGRGALLYPDDLRDAGGQRDVSAGAVGRLVTAALSDGDPGGILLPPEPLYLRRPDAVAPGRPKQVRA